MHLYCLTRGIKKEIDQFITELQGKYLPFTMSGVDCFVQFAVRPIQLWEFVFPEPMKDVVLTTILGKDGGKTQHKKHNKFVWALRKILDVKKIPNYNTEKFMPISRQHMEIVGIGIKEDYYDEENKREGL
jgi:hypothetical protein